MNWRVYLTSIALPLKNAENATAPAATLVLGSLARQVSLRNSTKAPIPQAVLPAYGISWYKAAIHPLKTNRINDIMALLRRPLPSRSRNMAAWFLYERSICRVPPPPTPPPH